MWSPSAHAQSAMPAARPAPQPIDSRAILQMRATPEVRTIASAPYMADLGMTLDAPVVPGPTASPPSGGSAIPAGSLPAPNTGGGMPNQTIAAIEGSVTSVSGPEPKVAARANGTVSAQGTVAVQSGSVVVNRSSTKDQVEVRSTEAVLNWTTLDTATIDSTTDAINFLPAGTELEFVGTGTDYTVLNRIFGTPNASGVYRGIAFEGTVTSRLSDAGPIGGNVWFYSPGGILVSSTAAFNVGGLVLTTSNLAQIDKLGTELNFLGVSEPGSQVMIENGAAVNAGDYVVMWAPRIEQAGNVRATGNVSYVGAEQGQLIVTGGLFDMSVSVGTEDANGIVHTGTTGGATPIDNPTRAISMASVAKNDFVTMLVGGNIGYDNASAASISNGVVFLTSGEDSKPGSGNIALGAGAFTSSTLMRAFGETSIKLDGQNQTLTVGNAANESDFFIISEGELNISATGGSSIFAADNFFALAGNGQTGGTVNITVDDAGRNDDTSFSGLIVGGNLTVGVQAVGTNDTNTGGVGGDAIGGQINIDLSQGGEIIAGGNLSLQAFAQAGFGETLAGTAQGGTVNLNMTGQNSRLLVGGTISADTSGRAAVNPASGGFDPFVGGNSTGGDIRFTLVDGLLNAAEIRLSSGATATSGLQATADAPDATSGSIAFANSATINVPLIALTSDALGGNGGRSFGSPPGGNGGTATAGDIALTGVSDFIGLASLEITATAVGGVGGAAGVGGSGGAGGNARAGNVLIDLDSGVFEPGAISIDTTAVGGLGGNGADNAFTGDGGNAQAGNVAIDLLTTSTAASDVSIFAQGVGGTSGVTTGTVGVVGGNGGLGIGGNVSLTVSGSVNSFDTTGGLVISATGEGGNGFTAGALPDIDGDAGDGAGGSISIAALDGAQILAGPNGGTVSLSATGFTGSVRARRTTSAQAGSFGAGTGGSISLISDGAGSLLDFDTGRLLLDVSANGANTTGGSIDIAARNAGDISVANIVQAFAQAQNFSLFDTSSGMGGTITVNVSAGSSLSANSLQLDASGDDSGAATALSESLQGGSTTGGTIVLDNSGTLTVDSIEMTATGLGGDGGSGVSFGAAGTGGTGTGGTASFNSTGTIVGLTFLQTDTSGIGGAGGDGGTGGSGGAGGDGFGGTSEVIAENDLATIVDLVVRSAGSGGTGGNGQVSGSGGIGGTGTGGSAVLSVSGTGPLLADLADASIEAGGRGGTGGVGGSGSSDEFSGAGASGGSGNGGTAAFIIGGVGASYDLDPQVVIFDADATGGTGGSGGTNLNGGIAGNGGTGGDATGGEIILEVGSGSTLTLLQATSDPFLLSATGTGGLGGTGGGIDMVSGGSAGNGGDGGTGTGGSPRLRAVGGTINGSAISLVAEGVGGTGGTGGDDLAVVLGAQGNGGTGVGGTPTIETFDGSPGIITLGTVTIDASGLAGGGTIAGSTAGGQITITDGSADPAGLISMTNLTVTATGTSTTAGTASLTLGSDSGPITVTNNMVADVSADIVFDFDGDGQLVVGNNAVLNAAGNILLTHTNNTGPVNSLDIGNDLTATAGLDFDAGANSIITASREVSITAQNIAFDTIAAGNDNIFDAGEFALTLNATNGSITSGPIGSLTAVAGVDLDATQAISIGDLAINDGPIRIDAGTTLGAGDITINQGGFVSNESIAINAGGDTTLGNVAAIDELTITSGGSLDALSLRATGITATAAGAVNIGDATIFNGVAGGGGITITGTSIILGSADASTLVGNDILLDAVAGGMTLGTINTEAFLDVAATGDIVFDTLTGAGVFLTTTAGNVTGSFASTDRNINTSRPRDVQITAPGDVVVTSFSTINDVEITAGSFETDSIITGNGAAGVASDVIINVIRNATIRSADVQGFIDVDAASITIGDIAVQAGSFLDSADGDIILDSVVTDGNVIVNSAANLLLGSSVKRGTDTFGNESMTFNAAGNVTVAGVIDSHDSINLTAGGAVDAQQLTAFDNVNVTAGTTANIAGVTTTVFGTGNTVTINAPIISLGASSLVGGLVANASGGNLDIFGDVSGGAAFDLDAAGDINFTTLTSSRQINLNAGANIVGGSTAGTGNRTIFNENHVFTAGGDITFTGTVFAKDSLTVTAVGSIDANAIGANANATLTAADITLDTSDVAGLLSVTSNTGGVLFTGLIQSGGGIAVNSATDIDFDRIENSNANLSLTAAANVTGVDAVNTAPVGSGGLDRTIINAGGDITLTGVAQSVDDGVFLTAAGNIDVATIDAADTISAIATGVVVVDTVRNANNFNATLRGSSVTLNSGALAGGLILDATAGDVSGAGVITVGGAIDLDATGNIGFGSLTANGLFNANAGGDISFSSASSTNTMTFDAGGNILGGTITTEQATASSEFTAGTDVILDDVTTRIFTVTAGNDIKLGNVDALGRDIRGIAIDLNAGGALSFASLTAGRGIDIDVGSVSGGGNIIADDGVNILANSIDVGDVEVLINGPIVLQATAGDLVTGNLTNTIFGISALASGSVTTGDLLTTGTANASDITVNAGTDADIGDATAGNQLTVTVGGNLTAGDLSSNVVSPGTALTVGGDADIASFTALAGPANIQVGGALAGGAFAADGVLTINAASIDILSANSVNGSVTANAISGDASFGAITAATNITVVAAGTPTIGSFDAGNNLSITGASVGLGGGSIAGDLNLTSTIGDLVLSLDGAEQIVVGGSATLSSAGGITVTHSNNTAGTLSLDVSGNILAQALGGSIDAQAGSILSGNEVFLLASGDIDVDDVRSVPGLIITAGGNVLVNNASATGPQGGSNFSGITIDAGLNPFFSPVYDNAAEARITGTVDSYANITVRSGGNAVFASGSTTVANDRLSVQTGDDIIVETGASLVSGRNPATAPDPSNPFNGVAALELQAGGLGNLLSVPLTPVASLVVGGTLDANNGAIIASAGAIDGLAGDFIASSIALDINGAPMTGMIQSDDAGLLSASCLQGNICVGNIAADNVLAIGQNSDNDVIQAIVEQGTVDANDILITTRNDIVMGTSGIATTLNAANVFSATSISGDVNLLDATISSGNILIEAAGSLLGSASLTSTGDIGITVGQDLNAASIVTGGELTTVADVSDAPEGFFSVPGNINIGTLEVGIGGVNYSASGNIDIGTIIVPGTDINLSAGGLAQLGFTDTANNVGLDGGSVVFGAIDATGDVTADSGSTIDIGTITAGNDIGLLAVGAITGGDLTAAGSLSLDGGSIAIGNASANLIGLTSGSDILFDLLQSPNGITLIAANGVIGANSGPGDIESDGDVSLTAQAIALNDITAGGSVDAQATAGNASFGTVETAADITITASGTPTLVNAISGGKTSITGQSVAFDNGTIGGDLALTATAGNVSSNGTVSVGGGIALNASGDIAFGSLEAQGGDFLVDAGGAISFVAATGSALVEMSAGSTLQGVSVDAAGDVSLEGSAVSVTDLLSGGSVDVTASAGGISLANTIALGSITLGATGDILADHAEAGTDFTGTADGNFTTGLNSIITGGDIQIVAGNIVNLGNSTAGGLIDVQGSQIDFVTLIAGGSIDLLTAVTPNTSVGNGDIAGTTVTAGAGASSMDAFGSILIGGTMTIGGGLTLDAADDIVLTATDVQGGDFIATAGGSISHGTTDVADALDFLAQSGDILGTGTVTTGNGAFLEATLGSIAGTEMFVGDGLDVLAGGTVDLQDVIMSAGPAKITAGGNITLQDVIGGDGTDISISSSNGTVSFADLQADGFVTVFAGNGPLVGLSIDAGSNATVEGDTVDVGSVASGGDITGIANVGGLLLGNAQASGSIALSAATDVSTGSLDAGTQISIGGESFSGTSLAAGTSIVIATAGDAQFTSASAGSDIDLVTGGDALADSLDAGDAIAVEADGLAQFGSVTTGTASGSTITISGHDGVVLNELIGFDASLISVAGPVSVDTEIDLAGSLAAEGNSVLLRSTKDLVVSSIANDGGIDISTLGNLTAAGAGATADILLSSPGDIVISDDVVAGGNLSVDAGNLVDVQALASGISIDVFSSDIVIGSDGAIGESDRTQAINFNSRASSATLGGAGGASDYQLDNDEFSRVFSGDRVSLISGDSDTGLLPVTIDELSVIAGAASDATDGNIGQGGGLFVIGSSIDVIGEAIVSNAGVDTKLGLFASGDVFLDAETGLLEVQAGTGDYTGSILIEAENFYAMTGAALADIQGLSIEDIDARLADSDGLDIPEGVIRAGTLDITTIASDVFIQNTVPGTAFDERRGFTVDQLLISDPSSSVQPIVINGVISGNTGIDAIPLADISSSFDPGSTINGCLIANPSSCIVIPIDIGPGDNPLRDLIDEEIEDDPVDTATIDTGLVELREDPLRRDDPLIDEPVTGAGNEDLWDFDSGDEDECESDENGVCLAQAAE
uniref:hypothetical protein n=1 Tax=Parerythrobacter lutipelagi TaxID=1964208 RepID=UPI0010F9AAA1|nr:hypothetical protein [Parerythrobacter lutipelagi]